MHLPIKTEMSYQLEADTGGTPVFIVGMSLNEISFKESKLKFLSGLGYAIYIAAFDLDDEAEDDKDTKELDVKAFFPRPLTSSNLAAFHSFANLEVRNKSPVDHSIDTVLEDQFSLKSQRSSSESSVNSGLFIGESPINRKTVKTILATVDNEIERLGSFDKVSNYPNPLIEKTPFVTSFPKVSEIQTVKLPPIKGDKSPGIDDKKIVENIFPSKLPPTWEPVASFNFPVIELPVKFNLLDDLSLDIFTDVKHIADGSNANVFLANFNNERVIIKMIKAEVQNNPVATHEFDLEHGMLARISHKNIIKVLGAGKTPRRFIVLEYLGGGSLNSLLADHQAKPGLAQKLFRKPSFTYSNLLSRAKDMAEALDYLHFRCHPGATIIHRG